MKMASLAKWFLVVSGCLCVSAYADKGLSSAALDAAIDPFIQQAKLTAPNGAGGGLGSSVALSSDGDTAIAGAPWEDVDGNSIRGSAYVFTRSGVNFTQQAKLIAPDGVASNRFGSAVALSGDGNTAIVGANAAQVGGNAHQGAVYVFTRSGTVWTQQAKLCASDGAARYFFGSSAALSSDGDTAVFGAVGADVGETEYVGAAYVFTRSGTNWTEQAKLAAAGGSVNDQFGCSVALSSNGGFAIVGSDSADVGGMTNRGAAYVFTRSGDYWMQQAKLTASDGAAYDFFGCSVALSSDRTTFIAGAEGADVGDNSGQGAAYVMSVRQSSIGPLIKANGAMGVVPIKYPQAVSVTIGMNADIYAGVPVDWWVIAYAHNGAGWLYFSSDFNWMSPVQGLFSFCQPVYEGPLFNLPSTPVLNGVILPRGMYNFWFAIDYPMDGILNLGGPILYDAVTVIVQ